MEEPLEKEENGEEKELRKNLGIRRSVKIHNGFINYLDGSLQRGFGKRGTARGGRSRFATNERRSPAPGAWSLAEREGAKSYCAPWRCTCSVYRV